MQKTWMVFKDGKHGQKPRKKHESIPAAMEEAARLSEKHQPHKFLVVEVIGAVQFDGMLKITEVVGG